MSDRHCTPDELLDVAEGARRAASLPHLAGCAGCRAQLAAVQAALAEVAAVPPPEPPPLYWEQLSARVRDAVAALPRDQKARPMWRWSGWMMPRMVWPLAACALLVLAVAIVPRVRSAGRAGAGAAAATSPAPAREAASDGGESLSAALPATGADPNSSLLMFMQDLADRVDLDAAATVGLTPSGAVTEAAVSELSGDEQEELGRLLRDALKGV